MLVYFRYQVAFTHVCTRSGVGKCGLGISFSWKGMTSPHAVGLQPFRHNPSRRCTTLRAHLNAFAVHLHAFAERFQEFLHLSQFTLLTKLRLHTFACVSAHLQGFPEKRAIGIRFSGLCVCTASGLNEPYKC